MIRQPNVILGNDKVLITMGKKGELLGFFTPAGTMPNMWKSRLPACRWTTS